MTRPERRQNGLRVLRCRAFKRVHSSHSWIAKDERYWCLGYPSDPRHTRVSPPEMNS